MNSILSVSFRKFCAAGIGSLLPLLTTSSALAQTNSPNYFFTHLAGPLGGPDYVDGVGAIARFNTPMGVAADSMNNLYVTDRVNHAIRKISPVGVVTTLALVDGSGTSLQLFSMSGIVVDNTGTLYVADEWTDTVRKITPAGIVTTLAGAPYDHYYKGSAIQGESRDGTGSDARFFYPQGLTIDAAGNLFVADTFNHTIRKITPAGVVTTVAGTAGQPGETDGNGPAASFDNPQGIVVDNTGNLFVTDLFAIRKIAPNGDVTTLAGGALGQEGDADGVGGNARFFGPSGAALDGAGNLYVTDSRNETIRKITPEGTVTTLAGAPGQSGSADGIGQTARFRTPVGLTIDSAGSIIVADSGNHSIRKITTAGVVNTFASTVSGSGYADGTGTAARFNNPQGLAVDGAGTIFVADEGNYTLRKITASGVVTTLASLSIAWVPHSVALDKSGNVYVTNGFTIKKVTSDGTESELPSGFVESNGLVVDNAGNLYFTDGNAIDKMTPGGVVTPFAGMNIAGVGDGHFADGTATNARFSLPGGLALDDDGNLYVLDVGNFKLRKVTPDGVVSTLPFTVTIAAPSNTGGLARDRAGNFYYTDPWLCRVTKITPEGDTTIIGGAGVIGCTDGVGGAAHFNNPSGIAVDNAGNLYVADSGNHAIRKGVIAGPPVITAQPLSLTAAPGTNVQFSVTASGVPAPAFQWYFNGSVYPGATSNTLSFANARISDAGDYTLVVSNELGSVTSSKATLTIASEPASPPTTPSNGSGGGSLECWFVVGVLATGVASRIRLRINDPC